MRSAEEAIRDMTTALENLRALGQRMYDMAAEARLDVTQYASAREDASGESGGMGPAH